MARVPDLPPFLEAARVGDVDKIDEMLKADPRVANDTHTDGTTALHWAAIENQTGVVARLLNSPVNRDARGTTLAAHALHWAARMGHIESCQLFLASGVFVDVVDADGVTPLLFSAGCAHAPLAAFLIARGANVNHQDNAGMCALAWAMRRKAPTEVLSALLANDASVFLRDKNDWSILHWAARTDQGRHISHVLKRLSFADRSRLEGMLSCNAQSASNIAAAHDHVHALYHLRKYSVEHNGFLSRAKIDENLQAQLMWRAASFVIFGYGAIFTFLSGWLLVTALIVSTLAFVTLCNAAWDERGTFFYAYMWSMTVAVTGTLIHGLATGGFGSHPLLTALLTLSVPPSVYFLYAAHYTDPGTIRFSRDESARLTVELALSSRHLTTRTFCFTCFLPRPIRSKHCSDCQKCVARFDHHCPFVDNCVGSGNHHYFLFYLASISVASAVGTAAFLFEVVARHRHELSADATATTKLGVWFYAEPWLLWIIFQIFAFALFIVCLLCVQVRNGMLELTTNETFNHRKYDYFDMPRSRRLAHTDDIVPDSPFSRDSLTNLRILLCAPSYIRARWSRIFTLQDFVSESVTV